MSLTKTHFNKAASNYSKRSGRGLWKAIRNNEVRAVKEMLSEANKAVAALDLGCGAGFYSNILHQQGIKDIVCIDFSEKMLNQIKAPQFQKIHAEIENFHTDRKFDIVLCAGVLEFTAEPQKVFENVSTMLKTGGAFILLYPSKTVLGSFYKNYHWWMHGLSVRLFHRREIQTYAAFAGLNFQRLLRAFPFSEVVMCIK